MMSKKRGQGLSTNAIILIVLGVFVLAILILGFTIGWAKLAPWISTNNVDTIVNSCNVACATHSQFDFCIASRELKADGVELKDVTCYTLANGDGLNKYGVDKCAAINCVSSVKCEDWKYTKDVTETKVLINNEEPATTDTPKLCSE